MLNATTWIKNNPHTGEIKPWELFWQTEGTPASHVSSSKTEDGAKKAQRSMIKRNAKWFNVVVL